MAKVVIAHGTKRYFNDEGQLHREDGPARINPYGYREWFIDGVLQYTRLVDGRYYFSVSNFIDRYDFPSGLKFTLDEDGIVWPEL